MISVLKNTVFILGYVQENKCGRDWIDKIIENDIRPVVSGLRNEYDFFIASTIIAICNMTEDFSNAEVLLVSIKEIIGKFIYLLEMAEKQIDTNLENKADFVDEIDTNRLVIGDVYKNYKELCNILGEKVLEGNSKKAQLKEWSRYFLWEKKGQKFIILDIYDEPLLKSDGRQNKNIYVQYIEIILLKLLSKQKNDKKAFYITTGQLWKLLGMANQDYKNISLEDLNDRITEYEVKTFDMNKFYQRTNQRLREILYSSLNNLQSRALINHEVQTVIVYIDKESELIYDIATDAQKKKILRAERQTLLDMKLESKRQAYAKFKDVEFFNILNTYLKEWYGWEYTFNRIKIIYNRVDVLNTVDKDEEKLKKDYSEIKTQRLLLNDKVVDSLNKNINTIVDNRHKKAEEEYKRALEKYMDEHLLFGDIPESFLPTKKDLKIFDYLEYSPYFVEIQNRLTDELISLRKSDQKMLIECNDREQKELDELFS